MQAKLRVIGGKTNKKEISLKLPSIVGRSREAGLTIAHPMISRQHCELFEAEGLVRIRDLGSTNGTFVAGKKVAESVLRPRDQFSVGPLTFEVDYEYAGDMAATEDVAVTPMPEFTPAASPESAAVADEKVFQFLADEEPPAEEPAKEPAAEAPVETPVKSPAKIPAKSPSKRPAKSPSKRPAFESQSQEASGEPTPPPPMPVAPPARQPDAPPAAAAVSSPAPEPEAPPAFEAAAAPPAEAFVPVEPRAPAEELAEEFSFVPPEEVPDLAGFALAEPDAPDFMAEPAAAKEPESWAEPAEEYAEFVPPPEPEVAAVDPPAAPPASTSEATEYFPTSPLARAMEDSAAPVPAWEPPEEVPDLDLEPAPPFPDVEAAEVEAAAPEFIPPPFVLPSVVATESVAAEGIVPGLAPAVETAAPEEFVPGIAPAGGEMPDFSAWDAASAGESPPAFDAAPEFAPMAGPAVPEAPSPPETPAPDQAVPWEPAAGDGQAVSFEEVGEAGNPWDAAAPAAPDVPPAPPSPPKGKAKKGGWWPFGKAKPAAKKGAAGQGGNVDNFLDGLE